jgi:hypothetical protein
VALRQIIRRSAQIVDVLGDAELGISYFHPAGATKPTIFCQGAASVESIGEILFRLVERLDDCKRSVRSACR